MTNVVVDHGMVELIDATRDDFDWDTLDAPKKTTTDLTNGSCSIYFGSTRSSPQTEVTSRGSSEHLHTFVLQRTC